MPNDEKQSREWGINPITWELIMVFVIWCLAYRPNQRLYKIPISDNIGN